MKIATASLDYYHQNSEAKCRAAGQKVAKQNVDFAGFTEVRSKVMMKGLETGLGSAYDLQGESKESPVANRRGRWKLDDFMVKKATEGEGGITPTLYLVIGVYHNIRKPRKVIEVIVTHMVPLTLHGKKRENFAHRMDMWRNHWAILKEVVRDALALGHSVFVIGDFNNTGAAKNIIKQIHAKAKWIIRKGLDWVFAVEGKTKIRRMGITRKFSTGSDHPGYWRTVILA